MNKVQLAFLRTQEIYYEDDAWIEAIVPVDNSVNLTKLAGFLVKWTLDKERAKLAAFGRFMTSWLCYDTLSGYLFDHHHIGEFVRDFSQVTSHPAPLNKELTKIFGVSLTFEELGFWKIVRFDEIAAKSTFEVVLNFDPEHQ